MVGCGNLVIPWDRRPSVAIPFVKAKSALPMGVNRADALKLRAPWSTTTIGTCCLVIALTSLYQCSNHYHQFFKRNQNNCYFALNSGYRRTQSIVDSLRSRACVMCPHEAFGKVDQVIGSPKLSKGLPVQINLCDLCNEEQVGLDQECHLVLSRGLSRGQSPSPSMKWICKKEVCRMVHDILPDGSTWRGGEANFIKEWNLTFHNTRLHTPTEHPNWNALTWTP
jgi:hypothetical protein